MRVSAKIAAVLFAGTALGVATTFYTVFWNSMPGGVSDGPWKTNLAIGSEQGDPYTRAAVAVHGLLALNRRETIYYTATRDGAGDTLDGHCRYTLTGRDPDARWWSITAYGADDYLIPNPARRYAVSKASIARLGDGSFAVDVGPGDAAIVVTPQHFSLTLRLYNPGPTVALDPAHAALPAIVKDSCP